ncbi:MAG: RelA/SpoT family protein [Treponema sp.]|nr:RelA/SpoT family protein [Treponema sp.]
MSEEENIFKADINNPQALIQEFFNKYSYLSEQDREQILRAWNYLLEKCGDEKRDCGSPYYLHPLRIANILAQSKLDAESIVAGILHSIKDFGVTANDITRDFGPQIEKIIAGVNRIMDLPINSKTLLQADSIRKMLFAMVDDVRIILIKIADRLDRIRHIKSLQKETQRLLAEEIIDIWAPLADRLGMQTEKNEFEDLSLRYKNPDAYLQIEKIVAQSKAERAAYLESAVNKIKSAAYKHGIEVTITSRAKHFYSIYQKMRKRNKSASELYDLLALRILCENNTQCYTLIGIVHSLWTPLDGRFKDYIAVPKANGYQSLHTTVMCEGKPLEIQIRTYEMHNMAEHGIASHWLYKKGTNHDLVEADKLEIFNKLQKLKETVAKEGNSPGGKPFMDDESFSHLKNELLGDEIYVFTPKGDVRKLPAGATPIDFAYSIHSAIGEKIVAAKADGKIIPLSKELQNTQIIEIITNPQAHPTESQLKLVKTSKAHQKIHSWLMTNDPTFSERLSADKAEEAGVVTAGTDKKIGIPQNLLLKRKRPKRKEQSDVVHSPIMKNVLVQGERNVLYGFAQCCHPHYPNLIVGYVTRSKGITVHRADCLIYHRIPDKERKTIEVQWDDSDEK